MDNNNEPIMETTDWRTSITPHVRQKIVNKIMGTLEKHIPFSGPEGLNELRRIAARFEEKMYSRALNQANYLRMISMKMVAMETKSQPASGRLVNDNREPTVETGDWRTQLPPDSRQNIINNIMETLKKQLPFAGPEELRRTATTFEEKIYIKALNQADYHQKISLKMLTLETKTISIH